MAEPPAGHYRRNVGVHRVNADRCRTGAGDGARGGQGTAGQISRPSSDGGKKWAS